MWGIIPAAGSGTRIQPLACSKELLPVGSRMKDGMERPKAVSEYLVERLLLGGADKICFVIAPGKSDIVAYYTGRYDPLSIVYVVQPKPAGLCDALFRVAPLIAREETVLVGLPDTIWFPENGLSALGEEGLSFLLFPVEEPRLFDAVVLGQDGAVGEIQVKRADAQTNWIWGAFRLSGAVFQSLFELWQQRDRQDEYFGTLVNAWLVRGGKARGVRAGEFYVDVGTIAGYQGAVRLLDARRIGRRDGAVRA